MLLNLSTLHLGDVLMALPAMRAGDRVVARPQHRVPGAPVAWLDVGDGTVAKLHAEHQTDAWLRATGREPVRHTLLPPRLRRGVVIAPSVDGPERQWRGWGDLIHALPDAEVVRATDSRHWWMQALAGAACVVCPDTGTAHMADALGVPRVVALHGQGQAHFERYAPYWNRQRCIVRDTMSAITVDDVLEMIRG